MLSLTPSLLEKMHPNVKAGYDEFAMFEIGKGHNKKHGAEGKEKVPAEFQMLSLVAASRAKSPKSSGAPYFQARAIADYLASELGIHLEYRPFKQEEPYPVMRPFDHARSAQIWDKTSGQPLGTVGEYKPAVARNFKLPVYSAGFEISIEGLMDAAKPKEYEPLNRYPSLEQDFCLRAGSGDSYQKLTDFMLAQLGKLSAANGYSFSLAPLDIFQKAADKKHKQTTWRIELWHPERTLTTAETNKLFDKIAETANREIGAKRI